MFFLPESYKFIEEILFELNLKLIVLKAAKLIDRFDLDIFIIPNLI